jgi:multiple sugar transport system permease protein
MNKELTNIQELEKKVLIAKIIKYVLLYLFLTVMALFIIFPFYWMINTSLKSAEEARLIEPTLFPKVIMWSNYARAMEQATFGRYMLNTVIVGVVSTIGTLITTILAAFAFARLNFKGRDFIFSVFLATMMIPGEMMVITNYITVANIGWIKVKPDSIGIGVYAALIVPFLVSVFYIYLLRQNFKQIPNELYYAAKVDGTSDFKYLIKVMIPIAMPTIISITILKVMGAWNSYVWPNLVADTDNLRLITNGLRKAFTSDEGITSVNLQMAATTVVTLPLLFVFIFLRKYIMRGVSRSGIKG